MYIFFILTLQEEEMSMICIYNLFYDVDNFCNELEPALNKSLIDEGKKKRVKESSLSLSEVMTIVILFHSSDYRHFKAYYTEYVIKYMGQYFPGLVSYNRFVELMQTALLPLCCYLQTRKGRVAGISFIDSTPIIVCNNRRDHSHKVFKELAKWGKNSVGRFYGFKLHIVINECGELSAFKLTREIPTTESPFPT